LQSFFFGATSSKEKASNKFWYLKTVPLTIATTSFLSTFSLKPEAQRKSSQKEMPYRLRGERHCAWSTTFEKVDETIVQSECEHTYKSQFVIEISHARAI
jgi:hypothetical protein